MKPNTMARIYVAAVPVALLALAACSSIVRHPEVDHVKKIAIVSLYTNQEIPKVGGGGSNGGGLAFLKKAMKGKDTDDSDTNDRVRLAKYALEEYTKILDQVPGWKVVSNQVVVASRNYQELGKIDREMAGGSKTLASLGKFAQRMDQAKYNTPPKMWALHLDSKNRAQLEPKLAHLCKDLGVDAVAVIDLDLAYEAGFLSLGGTGAAHASVASSVKILNPEGKYAVLFPDVQPSGGKRFDSNTNITMVGGKIMMSGITERAFHEAIDKTAMNDLKIIREGIEKK